MIKKITPCDLDGFCPYCSSDDDYVNCEYWCGEDEPYDIPEEVR